MFTVGSARSQTRARRGAGVLEYDVSVTPAPERRVRDLYNASRSSGWPRLTAKGFLVLCGPDGVEERLALINAEALPCLEALAADAALA